MLNLSNRSNYQICFGVRYRKYLSYHFVVIHRYPSSWLILFLYNTQLTFKVTNQFFILYFTYLNFIFPYHRLTLVKRHYVFSKVSLFFWLKLYVYLLQVYSMLTSTGNGLINIRCFCQFLLSLCVVFSFCK